jgi:hypothetical protein
MAGTVAARARSRRSGGLRGAAGAKKSSTTDAAITTASNKKRKPSDDGNAKAGETLSPYSASAGSRGENEVGGDGGEDGVYVKIPPRVAEFATPNSWWLVDLHADDPKPSQGATVLVRRCMRAYGWTETKSRRVLAAYRQFLRAKAVKEDWGAAPLLSPSASVDQMWHQHILDVVNYAHDCVLLCGRVVGHNPEDAFDDDEARKFARRCATKEALIEVYGESGVDQSETGEWKEVFHKYASMPRAAVDTSSAAAASTTITINSSGDGKNSVRTPAQSTVRIKDLSRSDVYRDYAMRPSQRMERVFDHFAGVIGENVAILRFGIDGCSVKPDETPKMLGIEDGETIWCMREQTGC